MLIGWDEWGYTTLRQKLTEEKVTSNEEMPPRSIMWCKGRESTNAMTLVFGKEKGGFLKGVGTDVTYNKYFNVPHRKGSSKEEIKDLKVALHNGKLELEKKDDELKALSTNLNEQDQSLNLVLTHFNAKGADFPNLSHTVGISSDKIFESSETTRVSLKTKEPSKSITPIIAKPTKKQAETNSTTATPDTQLISMKSTTIANTKPTIKVVESKTATINPDIPTILPNKPLHQLIKCSLSYLYKRNIVAYGTVHLSSERQFIQFLYKMIAIKFPLMKW
ncbi:unnamed protein product [Lactuca saligna]|uniref:Uncharacterized protein n=1 Tax=Lactuca saligna TaxID=75948 RepID=A0AA35VGR5_LACSI|nr:unnamed protein product [Lactuca saligna]